MKDDERYVDCRQCGHIVSWLEHSLLKFAMPCPACGTENQFGRDAYIDDFEGYTMDEIMERRKSRRLSTNHNG